jgi:hypothetical protein
MGAQPAPMLDDYRRLIDEGRVWVAEVVAVSSPTSVTWLLSG